MNFPYFLTFTVLGLSAVFVQAQTAPINTIPEGITTYTIPATRALQNTTNYFSAPLANDPIYTGAVDTVTSNTIMVGDNPAPWTPNQLVGSTPYFVKILTGQQAGRILQVTGNTTNTLTLDLSDNTDQSVALTSSSLPTFSVAAGDTFEVFAGDTLSSLFGSTVNTTTNLLPTGLQPGTPASADSVGIYSPTQSAFLTYYFDSTLGYWKQINVAGNANNAVIRPYAAFLITRRQNEPQITFVLSGRVAEVNRLIKVTGGNSVFYDSSGFAVDTPLSKLDLGANWLQAPVATPTVALADTLSVWNSNTDQLDTYFQLSDKTWRKVDGGSADQSGFMILAGETVCILKRSPTNGTSVAGATSFLESTLPYNLNTSN